MKKSIYYWSPCLNPVGTVKSTINSAIALKRYGGQNYEVYLINACGEWNKYEDILIKNNVKTFNFGFNYFNFLPKEGFLQSRFSYLFIFLFSLIPFIKLIKSQKPDFVIAHLITSLPLLVMRLFNFQTQFILRISGMPRLNFIRKNFWKFISKKIFFITCPTIELEDKLKKINLFPKEKLSFLPDAIINFDNFIKKKNENLQNFEVFEKDRIIVSAGRLTKQKNFSYLISEFASFCEKNNQFKLIILGDGELKADLEKKIYELNLQRKVFLLGFKKNVFNIFKKAEVFVMSSLWEDPGFVMIEASMSNLFIISSDCPHGPKEFLNYGENGILFKNNIPGELSKSLFEYTQIGDTRKKKLRAKRNVSKYTKFRHFMKLNKILSEFK